MKLAAFVAGMVVLVSSGPTRATEQDALSRLRAAIGGEVALGNVQTVRARGTIANKPLKDHFDIACAIPVRFVKVIRGFSWSDANWTTGWEHTPGFGEPRLEPVLVGGGVSDYVHVRGFDGPTLIPARPRGFWENNPQAAALARDSANASLAEFLLPLLGATPSSYPVAAAMEEAAIVFRAAGNREWRLELDPGTQLPSRLSWSYPLPPNASPHVKQTVTVTEFSDYRFVGTLRWPHRLITTIDGKRVEDAEVTRYDVNTALSDKMFRK